MDQSMKFSLKNIENWRSWKMRFFWVGHRDFFFQKQNKKMLDLNENMQPIHMRYHLFLNHGWFLQNRGKDLILTNMHTTVIVCFDTMFSFRFWSQVFSSYMATNSKEDMILGTFISIISIMVKILIQLLT